MHRDEVVLPDEGVDLVDLDLQRIVGRGGERVDHHEQVALVVVDLGLQAEGGAVLDGQGVELEAARAAAAGCRDPARPGRSSARRRRAAAPHAPGPRWTPPGRRGRDRGSGTSGGTITRRRTATDLAAAVAARQTSRPPSRSRTP